jgi:sulfatase maturation enzyme AslB (radical SAM superfamily)
MRIIKKASPLIAKICGEQIFLPSAIYNKSNFVYIVELNGCKLFHSCLTGEVVEVDNFDDAYPYLVSNWFYVNQDLDEKTNVKRIQRLLTLLEKSRTSNYCEFDIVTTTHCNARCFYCYEAGYKRLSMNDEIATGVASFISKSASGNKVKIRWYGGEPLVNHKAISIISEQLHKKNTMFESTMISNGYLFNKELCFKAKEKWNLKSIVITLDGTEHVYNRIKDYKDITQNPYKKVVQNINDLIHEGIEVTIRVNIESHNLNDAKQLIREFSDKYKDNPLVSFMIMPLNNTDYNQKVESNMNTRDEICDEIVRIKEHLFSLGFKVHTKNISGLSGHTCLADNKEHLLIKPNGEIAFCPEYFDNQCIGTVFNLQGNIDFPEFRNHEYSKGEICEDCPLYAKCCFSSICPICKLPMCNPLMKKMALYDLDLAIRQRYKQYLINTK